MCAGGDLRPTLLGKCKHGFLSELSLEGEDEDEDGDVDGRR